MSDGAEMAAPRSHLPENRAPTSAAFDTDMNQRSAGSQRTRLQELRRQHGWSFFRSKNSAGGRAYRDALTASKSRFLPFTAAPRSYKAAVSSFRTSHNLQNENTLMPFDRLIGTEAARRVQNRGRPQTRVEARPDVDVQEVQGLLGAGTAGAAGAGMGPLGAGEAEIPDADQPSQVKEGATDRIRTPSPTSCRTTARKATSAGRTRRGKLR
jgi:hypothetical protein